MSRTALLSFPNHQPITMSNKTKLLPADRSRLVSKVINTLTASKIHRMSDEQLEAMLLLVDGDHLICDKKVCRTCTHVHAATHSDECNGCGSRDGFHEAKMISAWST